VPSGDADDEEEEAARSALSLTATWTHSVHSARAAARLMTNSLSVPNPAMARSVMSVDSRLRATTMGMIASKRSATSFLTCVEEEEEEERERR
jgi:hypothetical protein